MTCPHCGADSYSATFCTRCRKRISGESTYSGAAPSAPPPRPARSSSGSNPAQTAALASLVAPLVVMFLNAATTAAKGQLEGKLVAIAIFGLNMVALAIGVIAAITALILIAKYGAERVLVRAILGLVLCGGILAGSGIAFMQGFRNAQERNRLDAELDESTDSMQALLERAAKGQDVGQEGVASLANMANILRKSGQAAKEPEKSVLLSLADVTESAVAAMQAKDAATRAFIDAGGISPNGLTSREAIAARIELARNARTVIDQFEGTMGELPAQLQKLMADRQVPADRAAKTSGDYVKSFNLPMIVELCRVQRGVFDGAIELLGLLDSSFGRWSMNADNLQFQDGDLVERYNEVLGRVQAGAAEESKIQQRIADSRKKK
jgi:hypothetical protein